MYFYFHHVDNNVVLRQCLAHLVTLLQVPAPPAAGNSEHCWENHVDKELKREAGARPDQGPMTWAMLTFEAPIMELLGDISS